MLNKIHAQAKGFELRKGLKKFLMHNEIFRSSIYLTKKKMKIRFDYSI